MIQDPFFDIQDDQGTRKDRHYRVHPDVYRLINKLRAVARAAQAVPVSRECSYMTRDDGERTYLVGQEAMYALTAALAALEAP